MTLSVLDYLVGVLFTFMLGFSINFLPGVLSIWARRRLFWCGATILLGLMQWQLSLNEVYWTGHWILVVWTPMVAIALLVFSLREPTWEWRWLGSKGLVWLGHVSFGIYLWHFQVMRALVLLWPELWNTPSMSLLALVISLPATLALAALSYYCVERPLMVGGSTVLRRRVLGPRSNRHVKGRFPVSVCHDMPRAIAETQTGHLRGTAE